jgi:hypothetical protein
MMYSLKSRRAFLPTFSLFSFLYPLQVLGPNLFKNGHSQRGGGLWRPPGGLVGFRCLAQGGGFHYTPFRGRDPFIGCGVARREGCSVDGRPEAGRAQLN